MDSEALGRFVVEAHRNGYATAGAEETADGLKTIAYERDEWRYVDRYAGSREFVGFEVVHRHGEPVWGMNYYGTLADRASADPVYGFLREALAAVSTEYPFRGPPLRGERYVYENESTGGLDRFHGAETIREAEGDTGQDPPVYEGFYRGGLVD